MDKACPVPTDYFNYKHIKYLNFINFGSFKNFRSLDSDEIKGEVELRSYDGMIAHISIVMLRYIFISVEQRDSVDGKTLGGMYQEILNEMQDITLFEALKTIFAYIFENISKNEHLTKEILDQIFEIFIGAVVKKFNLKPMTA